MGDINALLDELVAKIEEIRTQFGAPAEAEPEVPLAPQTDEEVVAGIPPAPMDEKKRMF